MDLAAAMKIFQLPCSCEQAGRRRSQKYCCAELAARGGDGAQIEVAMPGRYRVKRWDVGLLVGGEPRLGISCKSIVSNFSGTVPNRVDDMLGEAVLTGPIPTLRSATCS